MIGLLSNLSTSFVVNINFRYDTWKGAKDMRKRTSWNHFQKRHKSRLNGKAHQNTKLDPSVTTGRIRSQRRTDHAKAVARGAHERCDLTLVRAHPPWRQLGPTFFRRLHGGMHWTVSPTTKFRSPWTVLWSYKLRPPLLHLNISRYKKIEGVVLYFSISLALAILDLG